ncbi:MAG: hypothetical protein N2C13_06425 [Chloroflexota bacterium]
MSEILKFFEIYENAIYFILGLGIIIYGYRFWIAWEHLRNAVYGLEREIAQQWVNRSAVSLFLIFLLGVFVFSIVTFSPPFVPVEEFLFTPTVDLLGDTGSGESSENGGNGDVISTVTPLPTVSVDTQFCIAERINITSPTAGEVVRGIIDIEGTVDVEDFGFFQVEYARAQDGLWLPVAVEHRIIINGLLVETWDTSPIPPGDYILQLLVTDNAGTEYDACRIQVRVEPGGE